jgi:hypothetical protein
MGQRLPEGTTRGQAEIFAVKDVVLVGLGNGDLIVFFGAQRPHLDIEPQIFLALSRISLI